MDNEKQHKKENRENAKTDTQPDLELNTCSSCDCTGLIPSAAEDDSEIESYEQLYPYLPPTPKA